MLAGSTDGRLFRSDDGGRTWSGTQIDGQRPVQDVIATPDGALFATMGDPRRSYRSEDAGITWHLVDGVARVVAVAPSAPQVLYSDSARSVDGGRTWVTSVGGGRPRLLEGVAVHPRNPDRLLAVWRELFGSDDAGRTWARVLDAPVRDVVYDPITPETIYATTLWGFYRSQDGGRTWTQPSLDSLRRAASGDTVFFFASDHLRLSVGPPHTLFAYDPRHGLVRSVDGGDVWLRLGSALEAELQGYHQVEELLVTESEALLVSTDRGFLYRSEDLGATWQRTGHEISRPVLTQLVGGRGPNGETWYGANDQGLFRSRDRGLTWTRILATGATASIDPLNAEHVYARFRLGWPTSAWRLFHSADAGGGWLDAGLRDRDVIDLQVVPGDPGQAYASVTQDDGIELRHTADFGASWRAIDMAPDGRHTRRIHIVPDAPEQVFALVELQIGSYQTRVYRSGDGGRTWQPSALDVGLDLAMAWSPSEPAIAYAGLGERPEIAWPQGAAYFYRSGDGGRTWQQLESYGATGMEGLVVHPAEPRLLFAHAYDRAWMSRDGGRTWEALVPDGWEEPIVALRVDPEDPLRLYAATRAGLRTARLAQLPEPLPDPPGPVQSHATSPAKGRWQALVTDLPVLALAAAGDGSVWLASERLGRVRDARVEWFDTPLRLQPTTDLSVDAAGGVLTSPDLMRFDGQTWTPVLPDLVHLLLDDGVPSSVISILHANGALWLGVSDYYGFAGGGLYRADGRAYERVPVPKGNARNINVLAEAPDGALWVGMGGLVYAGSGPWGGLAALDGQAWRYYDLREGLAHPHVYDVGFAPHGVVWAGTEGGLTRFDPQARYGVSFTTRNSALVHDHVTALATDAAGVLWVGTMSGLSRFDGRVWSTYLSGETLLPHDHIHDLLVDERRRVWVATEAGLSLLDPADASSVVMATEVRPTEIVLHPNHPNPFNGQTKITFGLPSAGPARLVVHNVLGQRIRTLLEEPLEAGSHAVTWDGRDDAGRPAGSGVYVLSLAVGSEWRRLRMVLIR